MKGDEALLATLKGYMPGPLERKDMPKYRCFNRYYLPLLQIRVYFGIFSFQFFLKAPCTFVSKRILKNSPTFHYDRYALPYGGFEKANQLMKFQLPEASKQEPEDAVYQHEVGCRPSFNRTPIGWIGSGEPTSIHMENDAVVFDAETEEL